MESYRTIRKMLKKGANIKTVAGLLGRNCLKHTEKYTRAVGK